MTRRSGVLVGLLALLLAAALGWWFTRPVAVSAIGVRFAPLVRTVLFSGRVATASRVDVGSTLTGRVVQVAVEEAAQVRQGDLLVRLEAEELHAALEQAQANERQAVARLAGLRSTGRSAADAALAQTDSVLFAAQAELQRTVDLVAKGFVSEARLDEAQRAVAVAQAQQAGARAQRAANADQGTEVAQAQAQLGLAGAAVLAARARLEQTRLLAPADARVLVRSVEPGQIVQPGRSLLSLALSGPVQLVAQVDERFLDQLRVGQSADVLADAFPELRFKARIQSIAPLVDAQRAAVELKFVLIDRPPEFLREDMTLSLEVETGRRERALVVPLEALVGGSAGTRATLALERDGKVEMRAVRLGLRTLEAAEVVEGLNEGDTVLLGGALVAGQRVRATFDATALPAGAAAAAEPAPKRKQAGTREDAGAAMSNAMGR